MRAGWGRLLRWLRVLVVVIAGMALLGWPERAPWAVLFSLILIAGPLLRAWRAATGTALKAPVAWGMIAAGLGAVSQILAFAEPLSSGRPLAGYLTYLATLATLAALISVFNARTPGGGAWAILMALLVLVFLIPWLEGQGHGPAAPGLGRLRLDSPWTIFYGLLVVAGVTNYLPTRFGLSAVWLGLGFLLEYLALTRPERSAGAKALLWSAVPWTLAGAIATGEFMAIRATPSANRLEAVWLWFRDHWGVVWALRVTERFNRSAESKSWPIRLAWQGVITAGERGSLGSAPIIVPAAAEATLKSLLRRFAVASRIEAVVVSGVAPTCDPPGVG
jgi:hypothetical protein